MIHQAQKLGVYTSLFANMDITTKELVFQIQKYALIVPIQLTGSTPLIFGQMLVKFD